MFETSGFLRQKIAIACYVNKNTALKVEKIVCDVINNKYEWLRGVLC